MKEMIQEHFFYSHILNAPCIGPITSDMFKLSNFEKVPCTCKLSDLFCVYGTRRIICVRSNKIANTLYILFDQDFLQQMVKRRLITGTKTK